MKSNVEFRELAWKRLWADKWFGRLFGGGLLLALCGSAVQVVLSGILGRLGVMSWLDYAQVVAEHRQDPTVTVPQLTDAFISQASSSTVLTLFFSFIMAGIASYGGAVILRKCLANDGKDWLGEAFGGFRNPFGMLWLQLRYWLIFFFWGILAWLPVGMSVGISIPLMKRFAEANLTLTVAVVTLLTSVGVAALFAIYAVPFYRYRFLWLIKAEHPDWGAGACIAASRKLMKGNKFKSFKLDCSYWKAITLMLLPLLVLALTILVNEWQCGEGPQGVATIGAVAFVCLVAFLPLAIVVPKYISVGQGFLYEELRSRTFGEYPPSDSELPQGSGYSGAQANPD